MRAWLIVPAIIIILGALVYPTAWLLIRGFSEPSWGLQNFRDVLSEPVYAKVAWNTFSISFTVTALCLLLGYPLAYTIVHSRPAVQKFLMLCVLVPLWTSLLVRSFAWMVLLQDKGIINAALLSLKIISEPIALIYNRTGILIAMTQVQLSFMVLPLYAVMSRIDPHLVSASSTLGAGPIRTFLRVYLPLSLPGVISGSTLVFVLCLGYYITPALVGGRADMMIGQMIITQIGQFGAWGLAGAMSLLLLVAALGIFGLLNSLVRGRRQWIG